MKPKSKNRGAGIPFTLLALVCAMASPAFAQEKVIHPAGAATALVAGAIVHSLPPASQTVIIAGGSYMVDNGTYYQQQGADYVVVNPPVGATVTVLPNGATQTTINGAVCYQAAGVYYRPAMQNGATVYTVITP
jgi:hypothetical protein